ncbi:MAG: thioredoxin family protein [Bacilli bacterium]|nr:thioredoxin family protein [Bacilli bacterium]
MKLNEKGKIVDSLVIFLVIIIIGVLAYLSYYRFNEGEVINTKDIVKESISQIKILTNYQTNWELNVDLNNPTTDYMTKMEGVWKQSSNDIGYSEMTLTYNNEEINGEMYVTKEDNDLVGYKKTAKTEKWTKEPLDKEAEMVGATVVNTVTSLLENLMDSNEEIKGITSDDKEQRQVLEATFASTEIIKLTDVTFDEDIQGTTKIVLFINSSNNTYNIEKMIIETIISEDEITNATILFTVEFDNIGAIDQMTIPQAVIDEANLKEKLMSQITVSNFLELIKEDKNVFVYIGSDTCSGCVEMEETLLEVANDLDIKINYINLDTLNDEDYQIVLESVDVLAEENEIPFFARFNNNFIYDYTIGNADYETIKGICTDLAT